MLRSSVFTILNSKYFKDQNKKANCLNKIIQQKFNLSAGEAKAKFRNII